MSQALYDYGRDAFLNKVINWASDTIKVALVGSGYVANMNNDEFYSTVTGVIGTPMVLSSASTAAGIASAAASVTSGSIATGSTITQIVGYQDTGTASTSRLIFREDVTSTPTNGGTITLTWAQSILSITAASISGSNTTYTYTLTSGLGIGINSSVVITGMANAGNNGTFTITSMGSGTFTVVNASGVTASSQSGTGTISGQIFKL